MRPVDYNNLEVKRCSMCGLTKNVSEFNKTYSHPGPLANFRYRSRCKICEHQACREYGQNNRKRRNTRLRAWRSKNPERAKLKDKKARYKAIYGLTLEQVEAIKAANEHRCWICNRKSTILYIDHDHKTGRVRGALCPGCNSYLGRIFDDINIVKNLEAYLYGTIRHAKVFSVAANR